jgi:hypothetical protein
MSTSAAATNGEGKKFDNLFFEPANRENLLAGSFLEIYFIRD